MKPLNVLKYTFLAIGLACLAGAAWLWQDKAAFIARASTAPGEVVDLERRRLSSSTSPTSSSWTYAPVVAFADAAGERVTFTSSQSSNPPSYRVGEGVEVLYEPSDPDSATINSFVSIWFLPLFCAGFGLIFGGVGAGLIAAGARKHRRKSWLQEHGVPIAASLTDVKRNRRFKVNGRYPWQLVAQYLNPASNEIHTFTSDNIWFDPAPFLERDEVSVLVAPGDLSRYHVDLSFLPETAD